MIAVTKSVRTDEIIQSSKHVLFVEGHGDDSFDTQVIGELFDRRIPIKVLGPSYHLKSVAASLYKHHPTYYFLIDRDHHDDGFIDICWKNFPDPETSNLLIWRHREIENYFLEPDYLMNSVFIRVERRELEKKIIEFSQKRLYIDTANRVIISIREELKKKWIDIFTNPDDFISKEQAMETLRSVPEFNTFKEKIDVKINNAEIERRFDEFLHEMTGGADSLKFSVGKWIKMIQGKKIFSQLVNSRCFNVEDQQGNTLQGKIKLTEVAKDLLKKPIDKQPEDFKQLREIIMNRLGS